MQALGQLALEVQRRVDQSQPQPQPEHRDEERREARRLGRSALPDRKYRPDQRQQQGQAVPDQVAAQRRGELGHEVLGGPGRVHRLHVVLPGDGRRAHRHQQRIPPRGLRPGEVAAARARQEEHPQHGVQHDHVIAVDVAQEEEERAADQHRPPARLARRPQPPQDHAEHQRHTGHKQPVDQQRQEGDRLRHGHPAGRSEVDRRQPVGRGQRGGVMDAAVHHPPQPRREGRQQQRRPTAPRRCSPISPASRYTRQSRITPPTTRNRW